MVPPSTRQAAPVVADASGLRRYAARVATSFVVALRLIDDVGRTFSKNSFSKLSNDLPSCFASSQTKSSTPRGRVVPVSRLFTVIPVPAVASASPRAMAI
ncbi:hypothetical protein D1AOALGA4SA_2979 [Olavius algarvensis Delta 1 endosymbiont]|nr:hypothetical protein D1AOALGA4SA_2979 [Olavius algarvensis Delta 1 endosymbiont]